MGIQVRQSRDRGYFDYGWLKTFHTFSFGEYHDQAQKGFRSLRVINEDRLAPGVGFPLHSHYDMEIFSIVIKGGLTHQDDIGNGSIIREGKIQLMTAGRGITHSELNASDKEETHFLQMWILPNARKLKPSYQEKFFSPSSIQNQLCLIISPDGREGSLHIHQDASVYLSSLEKGKELHFELDPNRYGWVQVIKGEIEINDTLLKEGDGAAIQEEAVLHFQAKENTEFVLINLS